MELGAPSESTTHLNYVYKPGKKNYSLIAVFLVLGMLTAVAMVISIVALSKHVTMGYDVTSDSEVQPMAGAYPIQINSGSRQFVSSPGNMGQRVWTIAIGHDWGAHEYFDEKGYIRGFSQDVIQEVCRQAGMDCRTMWMPYTDCWMSNPGQHPTGGQGLLDRWVDACTGWYMTVDRSHVFDFSQAFIKVEPSFFFVKKGDTLDTTDLRGTKIGFINGWYSNEKCLARQQTSTRQNYILSKEQIMYADTPDELVRLLEAGTITAVFAGKGEMATYLDSRLDYISSQPMLCTLGGGSMMTRKDNPSFISQWNMGFQKLKSNGRFSKLCEEARARHDQQGHIDCVD